MDQLRSTPEMQRLGDREKRSNLTKFHTPVLFANLITDHRTNNVSNHTQKCLTGCGNGIVQCHRTKGLKNMKFDFLQKQTSRREMLRGSATLAGSAFLAHLFPAPLLRASAAGHAQQALSPADLLAHTREQIGRRERLLRVARCG